MFSNTSYISRTGLLCALLILTLWYIPYSFELLLVLNICLILAVGISRIYLVSNKQKNNVLHLPQGHKPMVSVHIPICSEPVSVVIDTIEAAVQQTYTNYEIIVLYNNTEDQNLWKPIESYCKKYPGLIKFYQIPFVRGYKAGALNLCREYTHPSAAYIFTVDADYQLHPKALQTAIHHADVRRADVVQFPQAYFNTHTATSGLSDNFEHYFTIYSQGSSDYKSTLPTGTLSLIDVEALDAIGGWTFESITEDAELGIRLLDKQFRITFVDRTIGRGLMPSDIKTLCKQRVRWIFGNFQLLLYQFRFKNIPLLQRWASVTQLSAWINFLGVPFAALLITSLLQIANPAKPVGHIYELSIGSIGLHLALQTWLLRLSLKEYSFPKHMALLWTHVAFWRLGAFCWWPCLLGVQKPFERTDKFGIKNSLNYRDFLIPMICIAAGIVSYTTYSTVMGGILHFLGVLSLSSVLYLYSQISFFQKEKTITKTL